MDALISSYLRLLNRDPLSALKTENLPNFDLKRMESTVLQSLEKQLFENVNLQTSNQLDSICMKFEFLCQIYKKSKDAGNWLKTLKRHHVFIVRMFEHKQDLNLIYTQLEFSFVQLWKLLKVPLGGEDDLKHRLLLGVSYVEYQGVIENQEDVANAVVALSMFCLQWLAQKLAKVIKENKESSGENISLLKLVPRSMLQTGNMHKWMMQRATTDIGKYRTNCKKLLQGFIKICERQIKTSTNVLDDTLTALKLRLAEVTKEMEKTDVNEQKLNKKENVTVPDLVQRVTSNVHLLKDDAILLQLKKLDWNTDSIAYFTQAFSTQMIDIVEFTKHYQNIFDHLIIIVKDTLSPPLIPSLKQMFSIFEIYKQRKRMRNVSNLLYNLGRKTSDTGLLETSALYECLVFGLEPTSASFDILVKKVKTMCCVINSSERNSNRSMQDNDIDNDIDNNKAVFLQFLRCCEKISVFSQTQLAQICDLFLQIPDRLMYLNAVSESFKLEFLQAISNHLRLNLSIKISTFRHKVEQFVTFSDLKNKAQVLNAFASDSEGYLELKKVKREIDPLASISQRLLDCSQFSQALIKDCFDTLRQWKPTSRCSREYDLIKHVFCFFQNHGLSSVILILAKILEDKVADLALQIYLQFAKCNACERLSMFDDWRKSLQILQLLLKRTQKTSIRDIINYRVENIKLCIAESNVNMAREKFAELIKVISQRPEFDTVRSNSLPLLERLNNFSILGNLHFLASKICHHPVDSYAHIKMSLQILYSIHKTCSDLPLKSSPLRSHESWIISYELKYRCLHLLSDVYECAILNLADLGLSNKLGVYLNEWTNINDLMDLPIVKEVNKLKLSLYGEIAKMKNFSTYTETNDTFVNKNITVMYLQQIKKGMGEYTENTHLDLQFVFKATQNALELNFDTITHIYELKQYQQFDLYNSQTNQFASNIKMSFEASLQKLIASSSPQYTPLDVQIFPAIANVTDPTIRQIPTEIFAALLDCKDQLLAMLQLSVSLVQLRLLLFLLSRCIHLISLIGVYKGKEMLLKLYFYQDLIKFNPFKNQRAIAVLPKLDFVPKSPRPFSQLNMDAEYQDFKLNLEFYLPNNYNVITMDICEHTGDLLLSKFSRGSLPIFIRLSLERYTDREGIDVMNFEGLKQEFNRIFEENRKLTHNSTTSMIKTVDDRKGWWKQRFTLDYELKDLCQHVEDFWLGGFKGIFASNNLNSHLYSKFKEELVKILQTLVSRTINEGIVLAEFVYECFFALLQYERSAVSDLLSYIILITSLHTNINSSNNRNNGKIAVSGIRLEKLHRAIEQLIDKFALLKGFDTKSHIVLIPSSRCSFFPWESMDILRSQSVTRVPSVSMLLETLKTEKEKEKVMGKEIGNKIGNKIGKEKGNKEHQEQVLDQRNVYYLINPGGDLKNSQERFGPIVDSFPHWRGLVGAKPDENQMVEDIMNSDLYIYIGHGSGDQYIKMSNLMKQTFDNTKSKSTNLPPTLLLGCSSGEIRDCGALEPQGTFLRWLSCKSPLIIANLWDVTDKDIDAFTITMFTHWGLIDEGSVDTRENLRNKSGNRDGNSIKGWSRENIAQAVKKSRSVCNLKYLNGAAPVIYGLPLSLNN